MTHSVTKAQDFQPCISSELRGLTEGHDYHSVPSSLKEEGGPHFAHQLDCLLGWHMFMKRKPSMH